MKSFGAGQVETDLPDVDFQAVLPRRGEALLDLVAMPAKHVAPRQHVAGVMGQAAPKHVGQNHVEAVLGQQPRRAVPLARKGAAAGVVPGGPALAVRRRLRAKIRLDQLLPCAIGRLEGFDKTLVGKLRAGGGKRLRGRIEMRECCAVALCLYLVGGLLEIAAGADSAGLLDFGLGHPAPQRRRPVANERGEQSLFALPIVAQENMADERRGRPTVGRPDRSAGPRRRTSGPRCGRHGRLAGLR